MTRHLHSCGHVHECQAPAPEDAPDGLVDERSVVYLIRSGWSEEEARETVLGWYDDEDRLGYDEGHVCCPDCGCDPEDHTLHRQDCPRCFPHGHPLERLQFGPPWEPLPAGASR